MKWDRQGQVINFTSSVIKSNPLKVLLSVGCTLLAGLTTGGNLFMLLPLLKLAGFPQNQANQSRAFELVNSVSQSLGFSFTLYTSFAIYICLAVFQALVGYVRSITDTQIVQTYKQRLRDELFSAIMHAEWGFIKGKKSTHLFNNLIGEINNIGYAITAIVTSFSTIILFFGYLSASFYLSVGMTLIASLCFLPLLLVQRQFNNKAYKTGEIMYWRHESLFGTVLDFINSFKLAKSHSFQHRYLSAFKQITAQTIGDERAYAQTTAMTDALYQIGTTLIICVVLVCAILLISIPPVDLLLMTYIATRLIPNFSSIVRNYQYLLNTLPAYEGVMTLLHEVQKHQEINTHKQPLTNVPVQAIRFENVGFYYEPDKPIFEHFTCEIPINQTTSIIGPSGRGKTTLLELLLGLLKPQVGQICIDNVDLAQLNLDDWRSFIAYIPQDCFLFNTTIRQNLLWAKPNATNDELKVALYSAAGEFVFDLPNGLETVVGDQGIRLSGGERQRIALARALLRGPRILILDEATNALDTDNERLIKTVIDKLKGTVTILIIAHNPYLHGSSDKKLVL